MQGKELSESKLIATDEYFNVRIKQTFPDKNYLTLCKTKLMNDSKKKLKLTLIC